jgi:hypothetical protein
MLFAGSGSEKEEEAETQTEGWMIIKSQERC